MKGNKCLANETQTMWPSAEGKEGHCYLGNHTVWQVTITWKWI